MSEREIDRDIDEGLRRLRDAPAPFASPTARARAMKAASAAFADAQPTQGRRGDERLNSGAHSGRWRALMQNRMLMGSAAAGVLLLPLAALIAVKGGLPVVERAPTLVDAAVRAERPVPRPMEETRQAATPAPEAKRKREIDNLAAVQADPELMLSYRLGASRADTDSKLQLLEARPAAPASSVAGAPSVEADLAVEAPRPSRDRFSSPARSGVVVTAENPVSTFSIDTDTASYAWIRRSISQGRLPSPDQVRTEELVNYFSYDYPLPESRDQPFRPSIAIYPTPWNAASRLIRIGIKGFDIAPQVRPAANLVFLVDTSGSMNEPDKLPLVQASLKLLLDRLGASDKVAIVTYAGSAGVALQPTAASDRATIRAAIDRLGAGGSTAGEAGIREAYALARKSFVEGGVNRVVLATDGDFNVGLSDDDSLTRLIETERRSGVYLSVLGFGQGNYNDALMQRLAQNGNGSAAYIDGLEEAQKVLSEEATSTLFPVAKDVKIQVEFNPAKVAEYRLIGYETRMLDRTDFKNDKVDAGEVGSGTAVTALYEVTPAGSAARLSDDLRYGRPAASAPSTAGEFGFLKIRYKLPSEDTSRLIEEPIAAGSELGDIAAASDDDRFAAAVAAFGQKLRGAPELAGMSYEAIASLADGARGRDPWGYRGAFVRLARMAGSLSPR